MTDDGGGGGGGGGTLSIPHTRRLWSRVLPKHYTLPGTWTQYLLFQVHKKTKLLKKDFVEEFSTL